MLHVLRVFYVHFMAVLRTRVLYDFRKLQQPHHVNTGQVSARGSGCDASIDVFLWASVIFSPKGRKRVAQVRGIQTRSGKANANFSEIYNNFLQPSKMDIVGNIIKLDRSEENYFLRVYWEKNVFDLIYSYFRARPYLSVVLIQK